MRNLMKAFVSNDRGTETVEWGVMASLIVGGLILVVAAIGAWILSRFTEMGTDLGADV